MPELNSAVKKNAASPQTITAQKNPGNGETNFGESVRINKHHLELFNSQPPYSKMNLVAASVRGADEAMQKIEKQIDQIKDQLIEHVKHYPPFDKTSAERIRLLKQFSAIRKQIDQLTIPPDNYGAMKIMADPSQIGDAGDWVIEMDADNGNQITIHNQQVHTGPGGLNISQIPGEASDDDIKGAIKNLESAKEILDHRRSTLSSDFQNILDRTHLWE
jgi:hypothetical protein